MALLETLQAQIRQGIANLWESKLAAKYAALDRREQKIVTLAAILLPVVIVVFGVLLPALDKNKALNIDVATQSVKLREANQLADQLVAHPSANRQAAGSNGGLLSKVDQIARDTKVRTFMTRLRPQQIMGGKSSVQVQMKDAPYADVAAFISALETSGSSISNLRIQAVGEGIVQVQVVIDG